MPGFAAGHQLVFFVGCQQPFGLEIQQDRFERQRRDLHGIAQVLNAECLLRIPECPAYEQHGIQRQTLPHGIRESRFLPADAQVFRVLDVERELCADKQGQPVQVQPDERNDCDREARVYRLSSRCSDNERRKDNDHAGPDEPASKAPEQCGDYSHTGVRHEPVEKRKNARNDEVWRQLARSDKQGADEFVLQQVLDDRLVLKRCDHT